MFRLSVRWRIFGGFAIVLALLLVLALVSQRSIVSVRSGAGRVSADSAQATGAAEVALQVADAHARVVQYVLSASLEDQTAAQASLQRLDQAMTGEPALQALSASYRATVNATIAAVEARRASVEQLVAAALDARTIVAAMVELLDRNTDPAVLHAGAHLAQSFGAADSAASRFVAARSPAEANAATTTVQSLPASLEALAKLTADDRRMQRLVGGLAAPMNKFADAVQKVVAADARLSDATRAREQAASAVLQAAAQRRGQATGSQRAAIVAMVGEVDAAERFGLATSVGAIAAGLLLAALIGRGISRPIHRLTGAMRELAGGRLDTEVPHTARHDELGEMARAVGVFREHMSKAAELTRAAGGRPDACRAGEAGRAGAHGRHRRDRDAHRDRAYRQAHRRDDGNGGRNGRFRRAHRGRGGKARPAPRRRRCPPHRRWRVPRNSSPPRSGKSAVRSASPPPSWAGRWKREQRRVPQWRP